jgi:hypothetical protein
VSAEEDVQHVCEAHLAACMEALWYEELENGDGTPPESPASAPFCGCDTCIVREVLWAGWYYLHPPTEAL